MPSQIQDRPTKAIVDLDALAFNFRSAKNFIGPDVKYMAVVKANGYGHGAVPCSIRLEKEGVDWFGVAMPEEGAELRSAGIMSPILCLGSFWPGQEEMVVKNQLIAAIYDERAASSLNRYGSENGVTIDIHVKIDTGMGRVGVRHDQADQFAAVLGTYTHLKVTGLMTHFASAENPGESEFTSLQMERFNRARDVFREAGHSPQWIDLANSPAAINRPDSRGNMVRLGGALYGLLDDILPDGMERPVLKPVMSLRSRIAHLKQVPQGESLGYGRTFVTTRDSVIALVPIGYADGYPRSLSNRGRVSINGHFAPVVGRISMDWTLMDVTDVPGVAVDDEVFLIGGEPAVSVVEVARLADTIGYEITGGISPRVPRVFVGSD